MLRQSSTSYNSANLGRRKQSDLVKVGHQCLRYHPLITIHNLAIFADTDEVLMTGGSFPVGNVEAVEHLVQQRKSREKKVKRSGEGRSPVSTLSPINHNS